MSVGSRNSGGPNRFEQFIARAMSRLRGQGGFILVTFGAVAIGCAAIPGAWWLAIVGAITTVVGVVLHLRLDPSYAALAQQAVDDRALAEATAESLQSALESILRRIARHCEINENHQRISIYCHVGGEFVMLARESTSTKLERSGRPVYPGEQGVIGEAWDRGESTRWNWPEDRREWNELQTSEYGMSPEVAEALAMQARSIVAMRLTHDNVHVGVIVMESTQPRGVMMRHLSAARQSLLLGSASEILASARPHFPAVAAHIKSAARHTSSL